VKSIDLLEHGGAAVAGQPVVVRYAGGQGYDWPLDDPREQNFQWVLTALHLRHLPSIPQDIPAWQHDVVFDRWCAAWDLPNFTDARRLAYLVDHYRAEISHDLSVYTHYDLGTLWRSRRWTLLLDIIDRLPAHSWYAAGVTMDEEHAEMMAASIAAREAAGEDTSSKGPSLTTWTPEVAALTNVVDAVHHVSWAVLAAQVGNKAGDPPKASPRPITPLEEALKRAQFQRRKAKHEAIVARVLRRPPVAAPEPIVEEVQKPTPLDVARVKSRSQHPVH